MDKKYFMFIFTLYIFLVPFDEALYMGFGSFLRIVGLLTILLILITNNKGFKLQRYHSFILLWFGLYFISFFWSSDNDGWLYFLKLYFIQLTLFFGLTSISYDDISMKRFEISLFLSSVISSIFLFFPGFSTYTLEGRRTLILFDRPLDPNVLASYLVLTSIILFNKIIVEKNNMILKVVSLITIGIGIMFTGSRGAIIAFLTGSVIIVLGHFKGKSSVKNSIKFIIPMLAIIYIAMNFLPDNLIMRFNLNNLLGFNERDLNVHSRTTIWRYSLDLIRSRPVFGHGGGNFVYSLGNVYRNAASHNIFILNLVELGFIGFFLIIIFFLEMIRESFKNKSVMSLSIIVTIIAISFFLDSFSFKYFWVFLILAIFYNKDNGFNSNSHNQHNKLEESNV